MDNTVGYKVAQAFLVKLAKVNALSASLCALILSSVSGYSGDADVAKNSLQPYEIFARRYVGGQGGIYEFINNTVLKEQGICNVDKGRLPQNEAFIFNEIAIGFKLGNEDLVGGVAYDAVLPPALRNAEFEITQNGRIVYTGTAASLNNLFTGQKEDDQWTKLNSLCYLVDNEDFVVAFKMPSGQTVAAGGTGATFAYLEVRIRGHRTIRRAI